MIFLFITFLFSQSLDSSSLEFIKKGLKILGVEEKELGYEKRWATDTIYRLFIIDSLFKKPLATPKYLDETVLFLKSNKDSLTKIYLFLLNQLKRKDFLGFSEKKEIRKIKKEIEEKRKSIKKISISNEKFYYLISAFLIGDNYYKKAFRKLKEEEIHILLGEIPYLFSDEESSEDDYLRGVILKEYNIPYDTTKEVELETLFSILRKVEMVEIYRANLSYLIGIEEFLKGLKDFSLEKDFEELEIEGISVALGGKGNNFYNKDYRIIIDLGGNDYYSSSNRGIILENFSSLIIDLEGDDYYQNKNRTFTFASGILGSGFLFDLKGNDVYYAGDFSLASGILGLGVLEDLEGDDIYQGKTFSLGAGFYGLGILFDFSGNDNYKIDNFGEGFGSTFGYGLIFDLEGNDVYYAGGKYLHIPLLPKDYRSFSQGFAMGFRPEVSGGIGFLCDIKGNDFYNGDVFTQGCSYWYSLGMLYDGEGNDKYYATEYAQGAGIHLAIGILVDSSGDDFYYSRLGPSQGEGHDLSIGILIDNDGDDFYYASGGQGIGLTNSFGLLLDKNGDDIYLNREEKFGQGFANQARGFGGIGLFIDLKGNDLYGKKGMGEDGTIWTGGIYACGIDELKEKEKKIEEEDTTVKNFEKMEIEELFKYASKWEVGSAKRIVREARAELIKRKEKAIEYIVKKLSTKNSLELRAIEEVSCSLPSLIKPYLMDSLNSENIQTRANVIYLIGKIKAKEAIPSLIKCLKDKRNKPRWILNAFAEIGDTSVFFEIINYLNSVDEPTRIYACYALGKLKDKRGTKYLIEKLKDNLFTVRQSAEIALGEIGVFSLKELLDNLSKTADENFQVNILRVINRIIPQLDTIKNLKERVEIKNILISYLDKENLSLKSLAIDGLGLFNEKEIKEILKKRIPFESNPLILRKLKEVTREL